MANSPKKKTGSKVVGRPFGSGPANPNFGRKISLNPSGRGRKYAALMSEGVREELTAIADPDTGETYASRIARHGVQALDRMLGHAKKTKTGHLPTIAVPLMQFISQIVEGKPKQTIEVKDAEFANRSKEELDFYAVNGFFPEEVQGAASA